MKQNKSKYRWVLTIFCVIIIFASIPIGANAAIDPIANLPLEKILNGDEELDAHVVKKSENTEEATILMAESTKEITELKLQMPSQKGETSYVLFSTEEGLSVKQIRIDPNGITNENGEKVSTGGSYNEASQIWSIDAGEYCKLNNEVNNDKVYLSKELGNLYDNTKTYYYLPIISVKDGDMPEYHLYIQVGEKTIAGLPLEKILNGDEELDAHVVKESENTEEATILMAESTKEITELKLQMPSQKGETSYVLFSTEEGLSVKQIRIDPNGITNENGEKVSTGGSYNEASQIWSIDAGEYCKLNNEVNNDKVYLSKELGNLYDNTKTYYYLPIISVKDGDMPEYHLYIKVGSGSNPVVKTPIASPAAGMYSAPIDVTLTSATADARIYYTLDDKEPTTASNLYSAPIHIASDTTLRVIAVKDGHADSSELRAVYRFETATETPNLVDGVYQIENAAQLVGLQSIVYSANNDVEARQKLKVKLVNDIDMQDVYLQKTEAQFYGDFDGNGKKLYHLNLNGGTGGLYLFKQNHGTIRNLGIELSTNLITSGNFGALCNINYGTIENCYVKGNLSIAMGSTGGNIGGLVNLNETTGKILNSYHEGEIIVTRGNNIGGLCAFNSGLIDRCYHKGNITVSNLEKFSSTNIGGIAGNNIDQNRQYLGTIQNCYSAALMHNTGYWGSDMFSGAQYYGNWAGAGIFPLVGNNNRNNAQYTEQLGTVKDSYYLDYIPSISNQRHVINVALSQEYRAYAGSNTIAGWKCNADSPFTAGNEYFAYYDTENGHFIVIGYSDAPSSSDGTIDAKNPSDTKVTCSLIGPQETPTKEFYLVTVPQGTKDVTFQNTMRVVDYTMGMNNTFFEAYNVFAHSSYQNRTMLSGTPVTSANVDAALQNAKSVLSAEGYAVIKSAFAVMKNDIAKSEETNDDITVTFQLIGATKSTSGNYDVGANRKDSQYVTWLATRSYTLKKGSTVNDLLQLAIKSSGMKTIGEDKGYVSAVYAPDILGNYYLAEFTNGPRSGWMYTVNGKHPSVALNAYMLKSGDRVIWHYINDYSYECSDWFNDRDYPQKGNASTWDPWLKVADVDPTKDTPTIGGAGQEEVKAVTTDTKTAATTAPTEVKVTEKTSADGTKETVAEVKVDAAHHDEIIKQAAENKSAEIVLEVEKTDTKGADSVQLSLDVTFVKNVADKTNADLTVNTENGKVTLDQETIKTVLAETKGATITLEVTKVSKPTEVQKKAAGANGHLLKLTIKSGDKVISDFNKGKVKVVAEIVSKLLNKKVAAIHIADDGKIEQLAGKVLTIGGKKYYEFTTPHFSTFALVDADELGLDVAEEPTVDAKALTAKLTPVARSAKTAKKNVKVTTSLDKQDKAIIKELKDAGYTVKYRFYRSTKKAAGYKAAVTKKTASYTNTSGKKGKKYYYKVQVRVYDANGKLAAKTALKQCKYASRTWTKTK